MSQTFPNRIMCFAFLLNFQFCFSQSNELLIADAIKEIVFLKRVVAEQDRRISDLERALKSIQSLTETKPRKQLLPPPGFSLSTQPWKTPSSWTQVKEGMSKAQVVGVLGQPTSSEKAISYLTMFYSGDVAGSGSVTGTVKLHDDRVWQVNLPVF